MSKALTIKQQLLATAVVISMTACSDTENSVGAGLSETSRTVPVIAEPVTMRAERSRIEAVGISRALRSAEIHAATSGEVEAIHFQGGEQVENNALLVTLDARDERLAVALAEVELEDAELTLTRYQKARGADAVPPTTLDAAQTALASARITLQRAQVALDDRFVHAPFAGIVGLTDVEPGDRIDPTDLITTMDDRSALLVQFEVPEALVGRVAEGDRIAIETWTADRIKASGSIVALSSRIEPTTRAIRVRARIPNVDDRLRPGMSFRVVLDLDGAIWPTIPEVALQWGASGPFVWTVSEGQAERLNVTVVQRLNGRILLDAPLAAGDLVVAEGVQRMRQGTRIEILDPQALADDARALLGSNANGR